MVILYICGRILRAKRLIENQIINYQKIIDEHETEEGEHKGFLHDIALPRCDRPMLRLPALSDTSRPLRVRLMWVGRCPAPTVSFRTEKCQF